jgi:PPE-repeat protein
MTAIPAIPSMDWHAMPPEVNTSRLMVGAGPAPMLQAAAGWEAFAILLETQADELMASLSSLASAWSGTASERAVSATMPMVLWLRMTSLQAMKRSLQAAAQAAAYSTAMVTTPPLVEIETNRVTTQVLYDTNFFFVNTVPIGVQEVDYWIRMWTQAAVVMDTYASETAMNTVFEPIMPLQPIVMPGMGEGTAASATGMTAAMAPGAAMREAAFAHVTGQATVESVGLTTGRMVGQGNMAATRAEGAARQGENAGQQASQQGQQSQQGAQQGVQMATQMASQLGSTLVQLPQQMGQMVTQPMQQLMSPLQQVTSMFSGSGSNHQVGLLGATPLSNHPLVGGSGMSSGAGLVRAASLPGAGGMSARTPLMSNLVGKVEPTTTPELEPVGAAAGAKGAGKAPVGGSGGGNPMGMGGERGKSGGTRQALLAPSPLPQNFDDDEDDEW